MLTITITHTAAEGTMASGDTREVKDVLKANGWRWSRRIGAWYLPHSRDRLPDRNRIARTTTALASAGGRVMTDIDEALPSTAVREANRAGRIAGRQEALSTKADREMCRSESSWDDVERIASAIPFGQPILVGHHSEARHRRDIAKIERGMQRASEAYDASEEYQRKADASRRHQRHRMSAPATQRRIDRLNAELRKMRRVIDSSPPRSDEAYLRWEREYRARIDAKVDEVCYWQDHLKQLEADGVKMWGPDDFAKGDFVQTAFGPRRIVRVNRKSLSLETGYSWNDRIPYSDVRGKVEVES